MQKNMSAINNLRKYGIGGKVVISPAVFKLGNNTLIEIMGLTKNYTFSEEEKDRSKGIVHLEEGIDVRWNISDYLENKRGLFLILDI